MRLKLFVWVRAYYVYNKYTYVCMYEWMNEWIVFICVHDRAYVCVCVRVYLIFSKIVFHRNVPKTIAIPWRSSGQSKTEIHLEKILKEVIEREKKNGMTVFLLVMVEVVVVLLLLLLWLSSSHLFVIFHPHYKCSANDKRELFLYSLLQILIAFRFLFLFARGCASVCVCVCFHLLKMISTWLWLLMFICFCFKSVSLIWTVIKIRINCVCVCVENLYEKICMCQQTNKSNLYFSASFSSSFSSSRMNSEKER